MRALLLFPAFFLLTGAAAGQNRFYDSTKLLFSKAATDRERLIILDSMGETNGLWSYPDTAQKYAHLELGLARKLNDGFTEDRALNYCGWTALVLGHYDEALAYAIEADQVTEARGDFLCLGINQLLLWEIYRDQGDFRHSLFHAYRCLQLFEQHFADTPCLDCRSVPYQNIGNTYERFGRLDSGLFFLMKAYDLRVQTLGSNNRGDLAGELGDVYARKGEYQRAMPYFREGIALCLRDSISKDLISVYNETADAFAGTGQLDSAIYYLKEIVRIGTVCRYRLGTMNATRQLSEIYHSLRQVDSAYKYIGLYVTQKDSSFSAQNLVNIEALAYNDQQRRQERSRQQQQAVSVALFWILIGLLFIIILTTIILVRNVSLRRKNEKLRFEKDRARLLQETNDLEMQVLRSQMNPHFIFNCLNAINRFIIMSEPQTASDYLTKFSRLIRMVLNHSKKPTIPLEDELAMLELYLDLERLRFKDRFDYQISLDEGLDSSAIFIPPLLLQPFVENAIWHGLMHKKDQGRVSIRVRRADHGIICEIEDNGVGRARAAELRSKSAEVKKSMGIEITRNRLALFNKTGLHSASVLINDLTDEAGRSAGTRVVVIITAGQEPKGAGVVWPEFDINSSMLQI